MTELPTVPFGPTRVTRLIGGGNPLCGYSHYSRRLDAEMVEYFTDENVVAYLERMEECGYDTIQARGDYHRVLHWIELHHRRGGRLQWIAQTASEMSDVFRNIRVLAAAGAIGIYHHGSQTDRFWREGRIDEVRDYLSCMRDCGVQVGMATHDPRVIEYAEEKGWDLDFYMACFYNLSRKPRESALVARARGEEAAPSESPSRAGDVPALSEPPDSGDEFRDGDPAEMCKVIRATDKTCLAFKILGAGRRCERQEDVAAAFRFAYANIKPTDAIVVGMFPKHEDQVLLNAQHAAETCVAAR